MSRGVTPTLRRRTTALGVVALAMLAVVVVANVTGEPRVPGLPTVRGSFIGDSFHDPRTLVNGGPLTWKATGAWESNGTAAVTQSAPATLRSGRPVSSDDEVSIAFEGDATGAETSLRFSASTVVDVSVGADDVRVVNRAFPVEEEVALTPAGDVVDLEVRLSRREDSLRVSLRRRGDEWVELAEVEALPTTAANLVLVARTTSVKIGRVEMLVAP